MRNQIPEKNQVAHIRNEVALHANIGFKTAKELCLLLLLISQINPQNEEEEMIGLISAHDIIRLVKGKGANRSGSAYSQVVDFIHRMKKGNYMDFPSNVLFEGKPLPKSITILTTLEPVEAPTGNIMYKFRFNEDMRPYIKGFKKEFVRLIIPNGIKSGHAVRFFWLVKAYHDRQKLHKKITKMPIEIAEMKRIFGIEGKYPVFKDFRRWVVEPITKDINEMGIIYIRAIQYQKTGRKITHIEFSLQDGTLGNNHPEISEQTGTVFDSLNLGSPPKNQKDFVPTAEDIAKLTWSQLFAYEYLTGRKCKNGIVYRQIIQKVPSSEYVGWEDIFVQKAWEHFEKITKHKRADRKAGAFVKWWKNGAFKDRLFSEIMEQVIQVKKGKTEEERSNRDIAKKMSAGEFKRWYKVNSGEKKKI